MTWQVLPPDLVEIRNRWRDAPRVGPWSRHRRSIELLRHAQADIATLLSHLDLTRRDPVADLCHELACLGGFAICIQAVKPLAGERAQYQVTWRVYWRDTPSAVQGWSPCVALRKAVRIQRGQHNPDSDALRGIA